MKLRLAGWFAVAVVLASAVALATSCVVVAERVAPRVAAGEERAPARELRVVQLIQRRPRLEDGRLQPGAAPAALDAALTIYTGEELPLGALATLVPESGAVWIVEHGAAAAAGPGPVARALAGRVRLLVEDPASVEVVDPARIATGPAATILRVVRPGWRDGTYDDSLGAAGGTAEGAYEPAGPLIVDLFDVRIDDGSWPADALLVGDPAAALIAARMIVTARATGAFPDPAGVERETGVDPRRIEWERVALAD